MIHYIGERHFNLAHPRTENRLSSCVSVHLEKQNTLTEVGPACVTRTLVDNGEMGAVVALEFFSEAGISGCSRHKTPLGGNDKACYKCLLN